MIYHVTMITLTAVAAVFSAGVFFWIKFIKQGPVYCGTKKLHGKTAIITGANVGIGLETAIALAKRHARMIIGCRNEEKAQKAVKEIKKASGNGSVYYIRVDLSDFASVRQFVDRFLENEDRLDILVNNAAASGPGHNRDGYDMMLAANQLGPFLLTNLLVPIMKKTSAESPVRIVNVSADAYHIGEVNFDQMKPTPTTHLSVTQAVKQYTNTKLMNIYFTLELDRRLKMDDPQCNITAFSLHPGIIDTHLGGDFADSKSRVLSYLVKILKRILLRSTFYGCQTTLYCCLEDGIEVHSGKYFRNLKQIELSPHASDLGVAKKLWEKCEQITELTTGLL